MNRFFLSLLSLSIAAAPLAQSAGAADAAMEPAAPALQSGGPQLKNLPVSSVKYNCGVALEADYKPIGYVSGAIVNRFSSGTPLLFTDLYFRALGRALNHRGFEKLV